MPTIRKTLDQIAAADGKAIDRERLDAMTDADVARQIAEDPDAAPEITEDDLKRARVVKPYHTSEKA